MQQKSSPETLTDFFGYITTDQELKSNEHIQKRI